MKFIRADIETVRDGLSDDLLKTTPIKSIKSKKFEIDLQKGRNLISLTSELANQAIIRCFFALLPLVLTFALIFLSAIISHMHK